MKYEAFEDRECIDEWRVEAIDHDSEGECYVAIFTGPNAKQRAEEYAAWKSGALSIPSSGEIEQVRIGDDGQIEIPAGWRRITSGPVRIGDCVLIPGTHAKWWLRAGRDPGCDATAYELVIREQEAPTPCET